MCNVDGGCMRTGSVRGRVFSRQCCDLCKSCVQGRLLSLWRCFHRTHGLHGRVFSFHGRFLRTSGVKGGVLLLQFSDDSAQSACLGDVGSVARVRGVLCGVITTATALASERGVAASY